MPTLNPLEFDAAIIDLDGTMVDTLGDFTATLNLMLADLAQPPVDAAFIAVTVGKGSEYLIERTLAHVGADAALYDAAWSSYQRHYASVNGQHADVFPGVTEGLERMTARGIRLACLTNKPTVFAVELLRTKNLGHFFRAVFGGDSFERKKPDPLPLIKTCATLGSAPARTLMVGDSSNDARAARAAGCPVALVTYGYNHGEPARDVDADSHVDRLDALFD